MSSPYPVLTAAQEHVLAHIANGATQTAAASSAGVHRNTVHNWLGSQAFRQALAQAKYLNACFWHDQAESLAASAFETIRALLADPATPAGVRLKAALAILDRVSRAPYYEDIPAPPTTHATLHNLAQAGPETEPEPSSEPGGDPSPVHNFAQAPRSEPVPPVIPIRREGPKTGRNDLCPCGSGKKYKRCCLGKPAPDAGVAANG
jgi:hypothetical protein